VHDGIDGWIDLFGPCDRSFQHLLGADLPLGDELGEGDGGDILRTSWPIS
jgi:hypothetical protein